MASESYHEPVGELSADTRDMHRALSSLQEEIEAVDWYRQRADACSDGQLRDILLHNMREEIEHAAMVLEWLRRQDATFDEHLRTYLFTSVPVTEVEEAATGSGSGAAEEATDDAADASEAEHPHAPTTLTVGSLKGGSHS